MSSTIKKQNSDHIMCSAGRGVMTANLKGGKVKSNKPKSARQRIDRNVTKVAAKVEQDEH